MAEYIDKNESVDESYLQNWYIDSVDEAGTPHWTEEHIEELVKDFIVIPIETPAADVEPVVRCKDCKHHQNCVIEIVGAFGDNDFCVLGKRKEN